MANNIIVKINEHLIISDLYTFARNFTTKTTELASYKINEFAKQAIAKYYGGYSPDFYVRTGQLRDNSFKPFIDSVGTHYRGGIEINTSWVDYLRHGSGVTTDEIVAWSWTQGYHGIRTDTQKYIMGKPDIKPFQWVSAQVYDKKFKNAIIREASNFAKKSKYNILNFDK